MVALAAPHRGVVGAFETNTLKKHRDPQTSLDLPRCSPDKTSISTDSPDDSVIASSSFCLSGKVMELSVDLGRSGDSVGCGGGARPGFVSTGR